MSVLSVFLRQISSPILLILPEEKRCLKIQNSMHSCVPNRYGKLHWCNYLTHCTYAYAYFVQWSLIWSPCKMQGTISHCPTAPGSQVTPCSSLFLDKNANWESDGTIASFFISTFLKQAHTRNFTLLTLNLDLLPVKTTERQNML